MQYLVDTFEGSGIVRLVENVDEGRRVLVEPVPDTDVIDEQDEVGDYARRLYRALAGMR
ncbi:MAG: hypothetical protein ACE5FA_12470 [Dehalococcoidia bacterium]